MKWTEEKEAYLVEEIKKMMQEGKTFRSAAKEMADRLGVTYGAVVWKYYKCRNKGLKKAVGENETSQKAEVVVAEATKTEAAEIIDDKNKAAGYWGVRMAHKPWTPEEDSMILEGVAKGLDFATIASKMRTGRSGVAVQSRYNELMKSIEEKAKANVARRQIVDKVEALNKAYKLLIAKSRTTKDGRLNSEALEEISAAVGLSYAQVMSLWGFINQRGFWMKAEIYKLEGIIASQKVEIELLRRKIKEQEEEIKELKIAAYNVQQIINKINTSA